MIAPFAPLAIIAPGSLAVVGVLVLLFFYPQILPPLGRLLGILAGFARKSDRGTRTGCKVPSPDVADAIGPLLRPVQTGNKRADGLSIWAALAVVGVAIAVLSWLLFRPR